MALEGKSNVIEMVVQLLSQHDGLSHMAEIVRILLNETMRVERTQVLEAEPCERSAKRRDYANGFKPKTVNTRLGRMQVAIPQVRGEVEFYPSSLERGVRSERALKLAVAEMYVQGVSTRKVEMERPTRISCLDSMVAVYP